MPALEIHHANGTVKTRELSRTQPLTIGKQPFNDICVPDDGVAAMHCRVLWNKSTFEVTAATGSGVEVNGTSVAHMRLQAGDVVRVGSVDFVYVDEDSDPESHEYQLRDIPETVHRGNPPAEGRQPRPQKPDGRIESKAPPHDDPGKHRQEPDSKPVDDLSLFEGPVYTESQAIEIYGDDDAPASLDSDIAGVKRKPVTGNREPEGKSTAGKRGVAMSLTPRARPGEQDVLRSPLVLGLSLGGLVLVLVTGIFWFLIGREQASRLYDRAVAELNEGQYAQSIASFEMFLQQYAGHSLHRQAERGLGKALVQKEIAGATPAWKRGLEQLQTLIAHHRNDPDFAELKPVLQRHAEEISVGAARTAETSRDADLLTVSEDAQVILERFADPAAPPTAILGKIKEARIAAVIAIGKQKLFDDGMAAVDAALKAGAPMVALSEREKLVRAYDGFASQKRVKDALQKALDLERSVIRTDDTERDAEAVDVAQPGRPGILALFHTRTRTDESSQGRTVFVLAKDCCYAVDTITGELVWRRMIGFDPPFFPVNIAGSQPGLLIYDAYQKSLLSCQPASGKLIWKLKLDGRPRSAPLIHEGQIYLPIDDRSLCRIDMESGRLTERATFSQNLHGPPILSADGIHLLVPGEMAMIYALSMRPLAAASTTFTDHAAGSLSAPPLALGKLLLLCENDKADSSILRLWNAGNPRAPLVELTSKSLRVRGQVREPPVLRGNQLMVASSGERLAAFSVTDEAGRAGLAPVAQYRVGEGDEANKDRTADSVKPEQAVFAAGPIASRVPMYLSLGADRQFWAASSAFRKFEIGADSIHMDSNSLALGIASQRLQLSGDTFFVGRKGLFHDAVVFSAVDRERMVSPWRTVLGAQLLELNSSRDGGAVGISESGHVVLMGSERLRQSGFDLKGVVELELPGNVSERPVTSTLHDGRMTLSVTGDVTQLWIIGRGGQIDFTTKVGRGDALQAEPVLIDAGLVVPVPGRLKVVPVASGKKAAQDWLTPVGENPSTPWKFITRLDGDNVLACDKRGLLSRVQLRMTDVPHLAEAAKFQLDHPVDLRPCIRGEALYVADAAGNLHQLNWRTFDQDGKRNFPTSLRGLWAIGSSCVTWSGDGKLQSVSDGRDLPIRWTLDLKGLEPAGSPLEEVDQLWIACRDGTVIVVDQRTGNEHRRIRIPQALSMGVKKLETGMFAVASDGTLYPLDPVVAQ